MVFGKCNIRNIGILGCSILEKLRKAKFHTLGTFKHQNTKTALYKLPKSHRIVALFEISGRVRNKSLVTVSLDHPASSDSDTKYFLSHDSNVMSVHQWKTFQVVVTDDVYPPTRLCWCNYTRGCQAVVTWGNV